MLLHCYVLRCCTFVEDQPLTLIKMMNWIELMWPIAFHAFIYWAKRNVHFNGLTFCIIQQWGAGKLPPSQEALFISSSLIVYALDYIDMDYVTFMKLTQNGTFSLVGFNKPCILTSAITCNLDIAESLHSNKEWRAGASPSSAEKGQWICCKPAWGMQMAPEVSMWHNHYWPCCT